MFNKIPQILGLIVVLSSVVVTACNPFVAAKEPDQITVQLSWFHTAEFAGFYVADQKGYYADENLKVSLVAGGPEADPIAAVLNGRAQFGVAAGDALIRARAADQDVVAVSSIFRQSPLVVMTLADSDIQRPQDLVGKTVGVISPNMDTTWDIQFLGMLKKLNIEPSAITFVPIEDYHGANELTSGRMQAASGFFSSNEPVQAQLDGQDITLLFYSDYGIEIYSNAIFTSGSTIHEQPDLVERFIRATLKGYQYAIEHPEEIADLALKYDDTLDANLQSATMQAQIPLIDTGDAPIGTMDEEVWQITQDILLEQGIISTSVDLKTVYTNKFVEKAQ
ncbi:MAG: ABC transporter substrate-binding protein [Anaerolineae bacterium]|nr:ABC transporter substrate-binding protein [Anaerolineae bacterium]